MELKTKYKVIQRFNLPPALFYSVTSDKTFLVSGNIWIEIPNDIKELSDIEINEQFSLKELEIIKQWSE